MFDCCDVSCAVEDTKKNNKNNNNPKTIKPATTKPTTAYRHELAKATTSSQPSSPPPSSPHPHIPPNPPANQKQRNKNKPNQPTNQTDKNPAHHATMQCYSVSLLFPATQLLINNTFNVKEGYIALSYYVLAFSERQLLVKAVMFNKSTFIQGS